MRATLLSYTTVLFVLPGSDETYVAGGPVGDLKGQIQGRSGIKQHKAEEEGGLPCSLSKVPADLAELVQSRPKVEQGNRAFIHLQQPITEMG